jgi:hypothetical protein
MCFGGLGAVMFTRVMVTGLSAFAAALTFVLNEAPTAQAQAVASNRDCDYWVNVRTGGKLRPTPLGIAVGNEIKVGNEHFSWDPTTKAFINVRTGGKLRPTPLGIAVGNEIKLGNEYFVWVPCPPPSTVSGGRQVGWSGGYFGGEIIKNGARVRSTETSAATGVITNQFDDDGDPIGAGLVAGYNFALGSNVIIGPFASMDWLNQTVNHNFAGGQFLGTTTHWIATVGGKFGYTAYPGVLVYGLAGASFLNHDLNVNFATAASQNTTTPGFTLGLGGEYQPSSWQLLGAPVSVFAQYQHTWYATANFNTPASSPAFNYAFKRDDDTVKVGINFYLSPPIESAPTYPVKAPRLK